MSQYYLVKYYYIMNITHLPSISDICYFMQYHYTTSCYIATTEP